MIIESKYDTNLESVVKKLFPEETIIFSGNKKVRIFSFLKFKNHSRTKTESDFYLYDIVETDKKICIDKKDPTDSLNYFVIDKKDIVKIEEIIDDGQSFKKITMIPKRMYEFQIFNFSNVDPSPIYFIARFVYRMTKMIDYLFGFAFAKMTTEVTY